MRSCPAPSCCLRGDHPPGPRLRRAGRQKDPADRRRAAVAPRPRAARRDARRRSTSISDIALTTNGSALAAKAATLKDAGLTRVTVSLDALDDETFAAMNDVGFPVARVLDGHRRCRAGRARAGEGQHGRQARRQRPRDRPRWPSGSAHSGHILRFIEYMDVGSTNGWRLDDVVPAARDPHAIDTRWPLEPLEPNYPARSPTATATATAPARSA